MSKSKEKSLYYLFVYPHIGSDLDKHRFQATNKRQVVGLMKTIMDNFNPEHVDVIKVDQRTQVFVNKDLKAFEEKLAALEHKQWIEWSKSLADTEKLSVGRLERWQKLWVPYCELTEEQKEQDRMWARKALRILETCVSL